MLKSKQLLKKVAGASMLLMMGLTISCGPSEQLAKVEPLTLSGISISEISSSGGSKSSIVLGWGSLPSSTKSVQIFRREEGQSDSAAVRVVEFSDTKKLSLTDNDTSLKDSTKYIYNLRADGAQGAVGTATSDPIELIGASNIPEFKLTVPATPDQKLKDPTGQGVEFSWEDAGTNLYHVSVSDLSGAVIWGAITSNTTLRYGAESGTNAVGGTVLPDLVIPQSLTEKLVISKKSANTSRNEVAFQGMKPGSYRVMVKAIKTSPDLGKLTSSKAIAIRPAAEIKFDAE